MRRTQNAEPPFPSKNVGWTVGDRLLPESRFQHHRDVLKDRRRRERQKFGERHGGVRGPAFPRSPSYPPEEREGHHVSFHTGAARSSEFQRPDPLPYFQRERAEIFYQPESRFPTCIGATAK